MCIWSTIIYQYIWKKLLTYQYFSFESVHGEAMLKMGWVVKKWIFSFWTALNWSKCILMVSIYIWLSIFRPTNNETLRIIWKFNLSLRGVLGRIYALSIEVLRHFYSPNKYSCEPAAPRYGWFTMCLQFTRHVSFAKNMATKRLKCIVKPLYLFTQVSRHLVHQSFSSKTILVSKRV